MDNIKKNPDKKLYIGAKIGLIANIINIIWSIIIAIILIAASDVILKFIQKKVPTGALPDVSTLFIVALVIGLLIVIGLSATIIILCNNVLKGKADSGLVVGILTLVLAGISLISICTMDFSFIGGINFIFLGFNIASGVLLVMGKYLPVTKTEEVVATVTESTVNE